MSDDDSLGPRLVDTADQNPEAARLITLAAPPRPLGPDALARVAEAVASAQGQGVRRRARVRWWAFASLGLAGAAAAATVTERIVVHMLAPQRLELPAPQPTATPRGKQVAVVIPTPAPAPAPAPPAPAPAPVPAARPRVAPRPAPRPVEAAPPVSALAEESALLQEALHKLRQENDPKAALAALDRHAARFPRGHLAPEADRTRVEALLLQGAARPALQVLDGLSFGASARDLDLALVRGELRAEAGRCAEAEADFNAVLGRAQQGARAERALYGRASCRSRRGDAAAARADLEAYLARFPAGRHAAEARRVLGK